MDSRFPTYYLNDRRVLRLSPEHFRLFVLANAWAVSNMTDGRISHEDLYLIPFADESGPEALVKQGLWAPEDDGWVITDFLKIQTSAAKLEAALENRREADRARQRKKREGEKALSALPDQPSRDGHVTVEGKEEEEAEERPSTKAVPSENASEVEPQKIDPAYPADPQAVKWRQQIDAAGITSEAQLAQDPRLTPNMARRMWRAAYPESRAA